MKRYDCLAQELSFSSGAKLDVGSPYEPFKLSRSAVHDMFGMRHIQRRACSPCRPSERPVAHSVPHATRGLLNHAPTTAGAKDIDLGVRECEGARDWSVFC